MKLRRPAVALLAAAIVLAAAGAAAADVLQAHAGAVDASLTWTPMGAQGARDVRLTIKRAGVQVLDEELQTDGRPTPDLPVGLMVRDLAGDGEPEVIADLYTGGAHCCTSSIIEQYDATSGSYLPLVHDWGDLGYRIEELGGGPGLELVSGDDRFAYTFACYACSAFPIEIWRYQPGRLEDVTSSYPSAIRKDAARLWKAYRRTARSRFPEVRGILAAWTADQALLGSSKGAFERLRKLEHRGVLHGDAPWPSGAKYVRALRRFLRTAGYL